MSKKMVYWDILKITNQINIQDLIFIFKIKCLQTFQQKLLLSVQEMNDLEKQYAAERRMMVDDALNKLNNKYDKLRDEMTKRQDKELRDLMVSTPSYLYQKYGMPRECHNKIKSLF